MAPKDVQDYAGLLLAGKSNADISAASKLQNFSLDILPKADAYQRYGKGIPETDFDKIWTDKVETGWKAFNAKQFVEHDLSVLNLPQIDTPFGMGIQGFGRPFMQDAPKNQTMRIYGGVPTQINTDASIAEGKSFYYMNGQKIPFTTEKSAFGTLNMDEKAQKKLDAMNMLLVAKPDPEDPSSVAWTAMPKTAAVSHEILRHTFGQNFSMF